MTHLSLRHSFATLALSGVALLVASGCARGPTPVEGGTRGVLRAGGAPLADVRVALFASDAGSEIGFAITRPDGSFALLLPDAAGPLRLAAGEYRATLESVGAEPLRFPAECGDPRRTPLRIAHPGDDAPLALDAPAPRVAQ